MNTLNSCIVAALGMLLIVWLVFSAPREDPTEHAAYIKLKAEVQGLRWDLEEAKIGCSSE